MSLTNIVKHGKYYYPAWKHYGNENNNVRCDRCNETKLKACIGYDQKDLCLSCANELTSLIDNHDFTFDPTFIPAPVPTPIPAPNPSPRFPKYPKFTHKISHHIDIPPMISESIMSDVYFDDDTLKFNNANNSREFNNANNSREFGNTNSSRCPRESYSSYYDK